MRTLVRGGLIGALNLHGNHLHVSPLQVLVKHVLVCHDHILGVATEVPIAFGLVARSIVGGMLLSKIGISTHCRGGKGKKEAKQSREDLFFFLTPSLDKTATNRSFKGFFQVPQATCDTSR